MRIRSLKPEILSDEKTASLPDDAFRLFVSLILMADDYGNLRASPKRIEAEVFWAQPGDPRDVSGMLVELHDAGLVTLYQLRGQAYAHLNGWEKHQKVDKPGKPHCPSLKDAGVPVGGVEALRDYLARTSRGLRESFASHSSNDSPPLLESLDASSCLTGTGTGTGTPIRTGTQTEARVMDSGEGSGPNQDATASQTKLTGYDLKWRFGQLRQGITGGFGWTAPRDSNGKAESFAAALSPEETADVEPTMRLLLERIKAGGKEFSKSEFKDPSYTFACWMSRFTALREELHESGPNGKASKLDDFDLGMLESMANGYGGETPAQRAEASAAIAARHAAKQQRRQESAG